MQLQLLETGHPKVVVHLFGYCLIRWPGWPGKRGNLVECEHPIVLGVEQHQPVRAHVLAVARDLVARAITQAKELPVELREPPAIGGVNRGMHEHRNSGHSNLLRPALNARKLRPPAQIRNPLRSMPSRFQPARSRNRTGWPKTSCLPPSP